MQGGKGWYFIKKKKQEIMSREVQRTFLTLPTLFWSTGFNFTGSMTCKSTAEKNQRHSRSIENDLRHSNSRVMATFFTTSKSGTTFMCPLPRRTASVWQQERKERSYSSGKSPPLFLHYFSSDKVVPPNWSSSKTFEVLGGFERFVLSSFFP